LVDIVTDLAPSEPKLGERRRLDARRRVLFALFVAPRPVHALVVVRERAESAQFAGGALMITAAAFAQPAARLLTS
jgi:hypothetical protein